MLAVVSSCQAQNMLAVEEYLVHRMQAVESSVDLSMETKMKIAPTLGQKDQELENHHSEAI